MSTCDDNNDSYHDTEEECTKSSKMSTFDDDNYIENEIYSDTISSIHDDNISYHNDKNDKNDKIIYHKHNHIIETQNSNNLIETQNSNNIIENSNHIYDKVKTL